ncbi:protein translocase component YidC [Streptococcus chenjunshii]|uniref:Membrane protein insertase YidC n=1 Tax=Streptococcus chenjunshii TaxID=2173853 RepID=A0A372KIU2_9STRE|nr:YidC/Oxa1 family membrane protein insertase [Streptococcus chenjunshii]AXQ77868.1 protein translocase component YidC [Streptococcus chenjunshii]RFU50006.1 protein translocase component YidC [Streptococcus chenjunshii]RFU52211.1 protein translocase component YidC [Streptococcus chenjunshii]
MKRKIKLSGVAGAALLLLSACSRSEVSASSGNGWDQLVYFFAKAIEWLSFGGSVGLGIVLFTIVIRALLMPLYNMQIKSGQKMQDLQPELKALQAQYPGKDSGSRMKLAEESQALYKKYGVNPHASFIPLAIQMPVMIALYQALTRVAFLRTGRFLWVELSQPDPYFILAVLAAVFTFLSSWLTNKAAKEKNFAMTIMTYLLPALIFFMGFRLASGVVLYWTVSNAFQVVQILLLNNPFKIIAERQRAEREAKERQARIRRAKKKAKKQRK